MIFDIFTRTRFFLFLAPTHADLWRQRGRVLDRVDSLSPTDPDYANRLRELFVAHKSHRLGLLLNLPDLTVQAEATPTVGILDRRKLVARRLDYLFPRAVLKGAKIGKSKTQLAALRPHAALTTTLHAIINAGVEIDWIAHAALEAARMIPKALQTSPYICVLRLGDTGLLLAGEQRLLLATRHLPLAQLDGADLAAEIQSTFAYLQRHGWQQARDLAFIGFGIAAPNVPGLTFTDTALYPEAEGYAELLANLVQARRPIQPLSQPRLQRRKHIQIFQHILAYAAMGAACMALVSLIACWQLFGMIQTENSKVTMAMATLPPPLAIQDTGLLKKLQTALDAPLALAAALPNDAIDGIAYQAAPLDNSESYTLRITAATVPALSGWQRDIKPNAAPISGTIGKTVKLQLDTFIFTYQAQP